MKIKTTRTKPLLAAKKQLQDTHQKRLIGNPAIVFNLIENIVARAVVLEGRPASESLLSDARSAVWQGLGQTLLNLMIENGGVTIPWIDSDGSIATTDIDFSSIGNELELISMLSEQEDQVLADVDAKAAEQPGRRKRATAVAQVVAPAVVTEPELETPAEEAPEIVPLAQEFALIEIGDAEELDAEAVAETEVTEKIELEAEASAAVETAPEAEVEEGDAHNQIAMPLEPVTDLGEEQQEDDLEAALEAALEADEAGIPDLSDDAGDEVVIEDDASTEYASLLKKLQEKKLSQ